MVFGMFISFSKCSGQLFSFEAFRLMPITIARSSKPPRKPWTMNIPCICLVYGNFSSFITRSPHPDPDIPKTPKTKCHRISPLVLYVVEPVQTHINISMSYEYMRYKQHTFSPPPSGVCCTYSYIWASRSMANWTHLMLTPATNVWQKQTATSTKKQVEEEKIQFVHRHCLYLYRFDCNICPSAGKRPSSTLYCAPTKIYYTTHRTVSVWLASWLVGANQCS